ncbi:MAG: 3,4-dihydroxyphenylacetate 2,3-dioxygenase [Gammaproteobacteria bacterium]|nr:MAG: 3,4-dihydroxyphenylacetate 2,3-dioxygenase [Gammaproteobacteria bacterium]
MGELVLAAKITHVPSMYLSEQPGPHQGCRQAAIDGHREISRRARERGADTLVVFDVHWLVNAGYHINCAPRFKGIYTSNELPHFIQDMAYECPGNPALGGLIAECAKEKGLNARAHQVPSLGLEYGTLVPNRYMNDDQHFKIISVSAWCDWHTLENSRLFGEAVVDAIVRSDSRVAIFSSGSLSHRFQDDGSPQDSMFDISREFYRQVGLKVLEFWTSGRFDLFTKMLPEYAEACQGEGGMHDTAMLLGALGWDNYRGPVDIVTDYFPSSGTGQCNVVFEVPGFSVAATTGTTT